MASGKALVRPGRWELVLAWGAALLTPVGFLVLLAAGGEYSADPGTATRHDITALAALALTAVLTAVAVLLGGRARRAGRTSGTAAAIVGGAIGICAVLMLSISIVADLLGWS
jgi:hypothetical protein